MRVHRQGIAIGLGDDSLHFRRRLVGRDQVVLELGQAAAHEFQRIAANRHDAVSAGQVQRLERAPDDPTAVIGIENVEPGPQAGDLGFDPELARGKAVESPEPGWRRSAVEHRPDPAAHFGRRLVGEGDGENPASGNTTTRYAVQNRSGQRLRLAGTGAGEHQDGAVLRGGSCLSRGQTGHHWVRPRLSGAVHGGTSRQPGLGWRPSAIRSCG